MMEKVEESISMIARNECETYYNKTIREVDEKVFNLRSEFNQLLNGTSFPLTQGSITNNSNNHYLKNNHHFQYPYALTPQPHLNISSANNQSITSIQSLYSHKNQKNNLTNVSQGKSYTVLQNATQQ